MADHTELRRLAEAAPLGPYWADPSLWIQMSDCDAYLEAVKPENLLALLDAAERAERATELLRRALVCVVTDNAILEDSLELQKDARALLAEVDRAE